MTSIRLMVDEALRQAGDPYRVGTTGLFTDADPDVFDCSGLTHWSSGRAHLLANDGLGALPAGSWYQAQFCLDRGLLIPVDEGIATYGALLFRFSYGPPWNKGRPNDAHVVISLGNGRTIEARGRAFGVGSFPADHRGFNYAGLVPDFDYQNPPTVPTTGDIPTPEKPLMQHIVYPDAPLKTGPYAGKQPQVLTEDAPYPLQASLLTQHDVDLLKQAGVPGPDAWGAADFGRLHILDRVDGK
jgi:hypothetical protein